MRWYGLRILIFVVSVICPHHDNLKLSPNDMVRARGLRRYRNSEWFQFCHHTAAQELVQKRMAAAKSIADLFLFALPLPAVFFWLLVSGHKSQEIFSWQRKGNCVLAIEEGRRWRTSRESWLFEFSPESVFPLHVVWTASVPRWVMAKARNLSIWQTTRPTWRCWMGACWDSCLIAWWMKVSTWRQYAIHLSSPSNQSLLRCCPGQPTWRFLLRFVPKFIF